jgi:hypothetical protein
VAKVASAADRVLAVMRAGADAGVYRATYAELRAAAGISNPRALSYALGTLTQAECVVLRARYHNGRPSEWTVLDGEPLGQTGWLRWTPDAEARLVAMRDAGATYREMQSALGGMSKGKVAGKLARLAEKGKGAVARASPSDRPAAGSTDRRTPATPEPAPGS